MAGAFGKMFGAGSTFGQLFLWGVAQQLLSAAVSPATQQILNLANSAAPLVPLSPAQSAGMVARGLTTGAHGASEAEKGGINGGRFRELVDSSASAPPLSTVFSALHRGLIGAGSGDPKSATLTGAMADAGIRPAWWPVLSKMTTDLPSWQSALNADLQGQLTRDEAVKWYLKAGGDPEAYQWMYDSNGQAPTPTQALELLNRGIIPERGTGPESTSYEQAFLEGPWRNKWLAPFLALREYLPPPRTVTAMYREGSLSRTEAIDLLTKFGLSADLAAKYVQDGDKQAATADRQLTQTAIIDLYQARIIPEADTQSMLETLGYSTQNATFLIKLADLRRAIAAVNTAVSRVHSLYVGHKINVATATSALHALQVPADQIDAILSTWTLEASVNVQALTASQIGQAFDKTLLTQDEAQFALESAGYTPLDAWTLLSIRKGEPLPNKPALSATSPTPIPFTGGT